MPVTPPPFDKRVFGTEMVELPVRKGGAAYWMRLEDTLEFYAHETSYDEGMVGEYDERAFEFVVDMGCRAHAALNGKDFDPDEYDDVLVRVER